MSKYSNRCNIEDVRTQMRCSCTASKGGSSARCLVAVGQWECEFGWQLGLGGYTGKPLESPKPIAAGALGIEDPNRTQYQGPDKPTTGDIAGVLWSPASVRVAHYWPQSPAGDTSSE